MPRFFRVMLFSLLSTWCLGGSIIYMRVHRGVLEERLKFPSGTRADQLRELRTQFRAAGCSSNELYDDEISKQNLPNLICKLPGREAGTIVIGAPTELAAGGPEGGTEWATLALLPLLAESVGSVPHRLSLTFVAFSGRQPGSRGASEYVKQLTKSQQQQIRAMISLQDVGRTPLVYALAQQDLLLANWLTLSSNTLRVDSRPMEITGRTVGESFTNSEPTFDPDKYLTDTKAFQRARVPAIALRSAPLSMIPAMHRAGAWPGASSGKSFDLDIYEQTYNQLSVFLLYLDSNLGTQHSSPPVSEDAQGSTFDGLGKAKSSPVLRGAVPPSANSAASGSPTTIASAGATASTPKLPEGGEQAATPPDIPVFRSHSQLVVMDISVTDARGAPVNGLQAGDFTLLEDGRPQAIRVFETHESRASGVAASQNALPPNTFSNGMSTAADEPLSILLFDLLNTPPNDQGYAQSQMLQYLRMMPRGKHIALFVLGTRLQMVEGSTDDPATLVKTAENLVRQISPLLTTEVQQQQDQGFTEEVGRHALPSTPSGLPASAAPAVAASRTDAQRTTGSVAQRTATSARTESIRAGQRTTMTLDALGAVARAVSGYPRRKNLVWLSGSFQIRLRPSDNSFLSPAARTTQAASAVSDLSTTFSYQGAIRNLTSVLATARIALYPIDVRGLRVGGPAIGVGADAGRSMVDPANHDAFNHTLSSQSEVRFGERSSMLDLAEQTGGRLFIDNDVRGAIGRSIEDGSNYYTLAYTPEKNNEDKAFRGVEIKLHHGSAILAYRHGYYPTPSSDSLQQSGAHLLAAAMQPGLPQSTMLLVTARVLAPDAASKAVRIDYNIDLSGLDFRDTVDNRKRAILECMAVALDGNGKVAGQVANTMDAAFQPQEYPAFQRTGLPLHQELVLPPGAYDLRLGVLDRASQKIGTIRVPLVIPAEKKTN